jgi:hypothetical protein
MPETYIAIKDHFSFEQSRNAFELKIPIFVDNIDTVFIR